ncbi:MAG: insulinase family protein [Myxococcaceae bacterium]
MGLLLSALPVEVVGGTGGAPKVVLAPRGGAVATLIVTFHTGTCDDGEGNGLTLLSQYALLDANRRKSNAALQEQLFASAASLTVETGQRECSFTLEAASSEFPALARDLLKMLLAPQLDANRFGAVLRHARTESGHRNETAWFLATLAPVLTGDASFMHPATLNPTLLDLYEFDQVRKHVAKRFQPGNATIVIAGGFDAKALKREVMAYSGGSRDLFTASKVQVPIRKEIPSGVEAHVLGYSWDRPEAATAAAERVLASALEEKLTSRLREAGVAYSVVVQPLQESWIKGLLVVVPAHDDASGLNLEPELAKAIGAFAAGDLDEDTFARARSKEIALQTLIDGEAGPLARQLSNSEGTGSPDELLKRLDELTRHSLTAHAVQLLDLSRRFYFKFDPGLQPQASPPGRPGSRP